MLNIMKSSETRNPIALRPMILFERKKPAKGHQSSEIRMETVQTQAQSAHAQEADLAKRLDSEQATLDSLNDRLNQLEHWLEGDGPSR